MTADWIHELFNQFDLQWNLAHGPSLETLTDEEYLWEPVPGCWSIRPTGPGGRGEFEAWPDPEPAPVTTIAWRLSHLAVGVFGLRASHYFGDGSLTHANAERPLTAKEGVAYFKEQALQWRSHVERLDEEGLARPVGEPEHAPVASLVLHVNREALHHLAEVSLLRDLYRATGGTRLVHPSPHVRPSEDQGLGMAPNTLSFMTIQSGRTARQLCAAADEALTEAAFRSGEFTEAERLFGEARTLAGCDGDREAEALAVGGLGMTLHHRNIASWSAVMRLLMRTWPPKRS